MLCKLEPDRYEWSGGAARSIAPRRLLEQLVHIRRLNGSRAHNQPTWRTDRPSHTPRVGSGPHTREVTAAVLLPPDMMGFAVGSLGGQWTFTFVCSSTVETRLVLGMVGWVDGGGGGWLARMILTGRSLQHLFRSRSCFCIGLLLEYLIARSR